MRLPSRAAWRVVATVVIMGLFLGSSAFFVYANVTFQAERSAVESVASDPAISVDYSPGAVVMKPTGQATGEGLVFLAGAKVEPLSYAYKLSGLVDAGVTVVIVRPTLNLALFELRPFSDFTALAPEVSSWAVGGHSLGGVRACLYAGSDPSVHGLVLFGSYCVNDLSKSELWAVSVSGENDGLSTPDSILKYQANLPVSTAMVEIPGANHAAFGNYGVQPGDGESSISSPAMRAAITDAVAGAQPSDSR